MESQVSDLKKTVNELNLKEVFLSAWRSIQRNGQLLIVIKKLENNTNNYNSETNRMNIGRVFFINPT